MPPTKNIIVQAAQVIVPCTDLTTSLDFFTGTLGFRVDLIFPADSPTTAVISGHGVCLRLEQQAASVVADARLELRLQCDDSISPTQLFGPDGVRVDLVTAQPVMVVPPGTQEFILTRNDVSAWGAGRAGMQYRDLIPGRLGGRFVASHIRVPNGGEVPDYVHFHRVRFQMIFCKAGWVRVVYEDQGPPFVMHAGDCVLQPPEIRHRVLEASPGLEVIEIGCPAVHETVADHALPLPTSQVQPGRTFSGQRFVRHIAAEAQWRPWCICGLQAPGFEACDVGIAAATDGLADVHIVKTPGPSERRNAVSVAHSGELLFVFVLDGSLALEGDATKPGAVHGHHQLRVGDCCVIPAGAPVILSSGDGLRMLTVAL